MNRPVVEEAVAQLQLPVEARWVTLPDWLDRLPKPLGLLRYFVWQAYAARVVRQCEREERIDVVHHVSFSSDSLPTALLASRAPTRVWGPVGGATRSTWGLYRYLTFRGAIAEVARDILGGALRATFGRWATRRATVLVALNHDTARLWRRERKPVLVESGTALEPGDLALDDSGAPVLAGGSLKVALFVARLVPYKGLLLSVRSLLYAPGWRLVVFGDGPDRKAAERLAIRLGVSDRVEFRGRVPRAEVVRAYRSADALLMPSFHDSSSWAAGEASALGCPVVCLDSGGPWLQAGDNAHVVQVKPERTLPQRIGECLESVRSRGVPSARLAADRLPLVVKQWYTALPAVSTSPSRAPQRA